MHKDEAEQVWSLRRHGDGEVTTIGEAAYAALIREGVDAVFVSRWAWDGRAKRREDDPDRRFPTP